MASWATFASAREAIASRAEMPKALSAASELDLHIGLHAGDVIHEDTNIYGGTVNIASRICGLSAPGEIFLSDVVRGMARSSAGVEVRGPRRAGDGRISVRCECMRCARVRATDG